MPCYPVSVPGGGSGFVCTSGRSRTPRRCSHPGCSEPTVALCDWKIGKRKTCSAALCLAHTFKPPGHKDKDLCPVHTRRYHEWIAEQPRELTLVPNG